MPTIRLNRGVIDKLKPDPDGRQKLVWDDKVRGLTVR